MIMQVLTIHEVEDWMLNIDLSEYDAFTFDDGLFSQYKHYKHFLSYGKPMYFFISTDIVCPKNVEQDESVVSYLEAHRKYEDGDKTPFMTWNQIKTLHNTPNCFIGGHGHTHLRVKKGSRGIQKTYWKIKGECNRMIELFIEHHITIDSFCYPYNEDVFGYKPTLREYGVENFFGSERIDIENIINNKESIR
jgi:hypothetical protein